MYFKAHATSSMTSQAPCVSTETKKLSRKSRKTVIELTKKLIKVKGSLDTNKQSDPL